MMMMMHVIFRLVNWEILLRIHKQRSVENTLRLCVTRPCPHFDPKDGYSLCLRNVDILTLAYSVTTTKTFSNYFTWVEQHIVLTDVLTAHVFITFRESEVWAVSTGKLTLSLSVRVSLSLSLSLVTRNVSGVSQARVKFLMTSRRRPKRLRPSTGTEIHRKKAYYQLPPRSPNFTPLLGSVSSPLCMWN